MSGRAWGGEWRSGLCAGDMGGERGLTVCVSRMG